MKINNTVEQKKYLIEISSNKTEEESAKCQTCAYWPANPQVFSNLTHITVPGIHA